MPAIGIVLMWAGYSVFYYGYNSLTGGNDSFLSLIWPGDYKPTARDSGSTAGGGAGGKGPLGPSKNPFSPRNVPCYVWGYLFTGRKCPGVLGG